MYKKLKCNFCESHVEQEGLCATCEIAKKRKIIDLAKAGILPTHDKYGHKIKRCPDPFDRALTKCDFFNFNPIDELWEKN
jgi:hypothetical protein